MGRQTNAIESMGLGQAIAFLMSNFSVIPYTEDEDLDCAFVWKSGPHESTIFFEPDEGGMASVYKEAIADFAEFITNDFIPLTEED